MQLNSLSSILYNLFGQPIFQIEKINVSLLFIVKLGITIIFTVYVIRLLDWFVKYRLLVRLGINKSNREEISLIFSYLAKILGIYFVLEASGFSLSSLTVIVGALGVGIGFVLQNIFNNLVSGVLLLTERKIKISDFVSLDNLSGYIKEISILTTVIQTLEGKEIIVPNSYLISINVFIQKGNKEDYSTAPKALRVAF